MGHNSDSIRCSAMSPSSFKSPLYLSAIVTLDDVELLCVLELVPDLLISREVQEFLSDFCDLVWMGND